MGDRITKLQGQSTRPGVYKCKDCRKPFSVTVGTVMERSHIRLSTWVWSAQIMSSSKKGFSALELQRMIGTNYETAWFLFHRLREAADALRGDDPLGGAGKIIEADEAYIGGKETNKHASKRSGKRGPSGKNASRYLGRARRQVTRLPHGECDGAKLQDALKKHTDAASTLMTDELSAYTTAGARFTAHEKVDHSRARNTPIASAKLACSSRRTAPSSISPCSSVAFTELSTASAKPIWIAIWPSSISGRTRGNYQIANVAPRSWPQPKAGDWCTKILTEPRTIKQKECASRRSTRKRESD